MNYVHTLINQIIAMFSMIAIGVYLDKKKYFDNNAIKSLGDFLFNILSPINIFNSFMIEYTPERGKQFIIALLISITSYAISIIISKVLFEKEKYAIEHYATIISNCGFLGLPIVKQVCGDEASIYAVAFVACNVCVQMTYGKYVMSKDKNDITINSIFLNISVIASIAGMLFFFLRIPVFSPIKSCLSSLSNIVAPISCILIGINLANTNIKSIVHDKACFASILISQLLIPFIIVIIMKFFSNDMYVMKLSLTIIAACPTASGTSIFARKYNLDYEKASRLVCVGTLLLIITMPIVTSIATTIW